MHLTFLGTGAATSVPLAFCRCAHCTAARKTGGKNIRRRSSLLINDDLLIDLGPDAVQAMFACGKDLTAVRTVLITHAHSDHFDPGHFTTRMAEYACEDPAPLLICCSKTSLRVLSDYTEREEGIRPDDNAGRTGLRLSVHACAAGETFACGKYHVTALYSRHDPSKDSRVYIVDDDRVRVLYATDMPAPDEAFYQALAAAGPVDLVIADHTYGPGMPDRPDSAHMSAHDVARMAKKLSALGLLRPEGQVWATHISHEHTPVHDELEAFAARNGYHAAWDGLEMEL
ncbi:MAG: MBL fold metallo-hydrolase [Oscillospiraceae bacterium]|nr:MBL fold metallo-hydrolase [Oscillospiraceae bacterium]